MEKLYFIHAHFVFRGVFCFCDITFSNWKSRRFTHCCIFSIAHHVLQSIINAFTSLSFKINVEKITNKRRISLGKMLKNAQKISWYSNNSLIIIIWQIYEIEFVNDKLFLLDENEFLLPFHTYREAFQRAFTLQKTTTAVERENVFYANHIWLNIGIDRRESQCLYGSLVVSFYIAFKHRHFMLQCSIVFDRGGMFFIIILREF